MVQGFELFPGEYVCEFFPADGEGMITEQEMFGGDAPDGMQLGGIPDEPELYVLSDAFRDTCTECLDQHEERDADPAEPSVNDKEVLLEYIPGYMPMAEAEVDKGVRSTGRVDVAVGHIINEQEGAGTIQVDGGFIVHSHEEVNIPFSQSTGVCTPYLINVFITVPALILLSIVLYLM
jgi:hypothetical protein